MSEPRSDGDKKAFTDDPPQFDATWKADFYTAAIQSLDIVGEAKAMGVSLTRLHRARLDDPQFDAACIEIDVCVNLALMHQLQFTALQGNTRAYSLLLRRGKEIRELAALAEAANLNEDPEVAATRAKVAKRRRMDAAKQKGIDLSFLELPPELPSQRLIDWRNENLERHKAGLPPIPWSPPKPTA